TGTSAISLFRGFPEELRCEPRIFPDTESPYISHAEVYLCSSEAARCCSLKPLCGARRVSINADSGLIKVTDFELRTGIAGVRSFLIRGGCASRIARNTLPRQECSAESDLLRNGAAFCLRLHFGYIRLIGSC